MGSIKFDVKITKENLSGFLLYHNYTHFNGIFGIFISLLAIVYLIYEFEHLDITKILILSVIAVLFIVVNPLMLRQKAGNQIKQSEAFKNSITYELKDEGFVLSQGDQQSEILWSDVVKVRDSGKSIIIYISKIRAFIWPKDQMGSCYLKVIGALRDKVDADKIKIKNNG